MGRLIDADKYKHGLNCAVSCTLQDERSQQILKAMLMALDMQPTAYDPDKVVEQLKKDSYTETQNDMDPFDPSEVVNLESAIEIVEGGGVDG